MKLVIESGSSKTDWIVSVDSTIIKRINTEGINPFFKNAEEIYSLVVRNFSESERDSIKQVEFYGSGCIKGKTCHIIEKALRQAFHEAKIIAESDMFAAAKALFSDQPGIACILGTGANSCLFDGTQIIDNIPPLGFILGDEGSGAVLGKTLLNHYFKRKLPKTLSAEFEKKYKLDKLAVLEAVYRGKKPNRYLASFSPFLYENKKHGYIRKLLFDNFTGFFDYHIISYKNYKNYKIGFVGSIAWYYSDILQEVAESKGLTIYKIIKSPIDELI